MIAYEIKYERTGSGESPKYDTVTLHRAGLETNNHESLEVEFERIAAGWGTHETRHAIVEVIGRRIG